MKISIHHDKLSALLPTGPLVDAETLAGGFSAELLENRSFERGKTGWEGYPAGADVSLAVKTDRPLFSETPRYLALTAGEGTGAVNRAFGGFSVKRKEELRLSLWLRSYDYKGKVLCGIKGEELFTFKKFKVRADGRWHRYAFRLKPKEDAAGVSFVFVLLSSGMVHLDCLSMVSANAVLGAFRRDMASLLKELSPAAIRFPDEGKSARAYPWKESLGEPGRRPSPVAESGVGFYEYFRLAEYAAALPLPVLAARESEEELVQDALDIKEFAAGERDTVWGGLRAELGHPAPFNLRYIGVPASLPADKFRAVEKTLSAEGLSLVPVEGDAAPQGEGFSDVLEETARAFEEGSFRPVPLFSEGKGGLVHFDADTAVPTARYHVRKLCNQYAGDFALMADGELPVSVSERDGFTYVKTVNLSDEEVTAEAEADFPLGELNRIILMTEDAPVPYDVAPAAPTSAKLPPRSFALLIFRK